MSGFEKVGEREIHRGHVLRLTESSFVGPAGERFTRDVVHTPGAVGVVPLLFDPEGTPSVLLVRQYRPAIESDLLEIPAGIRDVPGEPPEETARRELAEEVGMNAGRIERLTEYLPAAGFTNQRTHLFLALDLTPSTITAHGVEEQYMTVEQLPVGDAAGRIGAGEITDGKTIVALLLTERWLASADGAAG